MKATSTYGSKSNKSLAAEASEDIDDVEAPLITDDKENENILTSSSPASTEEMEKEKERSNEFHEDCRHVWHEIGISSLGGLGMFAESYFMFAVGQFEPIWALLYQDCYDDSPNCPTSLSESLTYVEMTAIIAGMIAFGFIANVIGRRYGSISTASIMLAGSIIWAAASGSDNTVLTMLNIAVFVFGFGVGGEYPLASVAAAERYEEERLMEHNNSHKRGRTVVLTFAMQGWGTVVNICVIMAILAATPSADCTPVPGNSTNFEPGTNCIDQDLNLTWRLTVVLGSLALIGILVFRVLKTKESAVWLKNKEHEENLSAKKQAGHKSRLCRVLTKYYWSRLVGTAFSWFFLDVALYGNRLYQASIVSQLVGGAPSLLQTYEYSLLNATFALVGYYVSALLVDHKWVGRVRLQLFGFAMMTILFLVSASMATTGSSNPISMQILYYLSSFFSQFPNCTTFLVPAEIFPTSVRTVSHGISAASGKLGALTVTLVFSFAFHQPTNSQIFNVSGFAAILGFIATLIFVPNTGFIELSELDKRFEAELDGTPSTYRGAAVQPSALSYMELAIGVHRRKAMKKDDDVNETED